MTRIHEKNYLEDDYGELIDLILNAGDVKKAFLTKGSKAWIKKVKDEFLVNGLSHLSNTQLEIMEGLLFKDKTFDDLCIDQLMSAEELQQEITTMKQVLIKYI